MEHVENNLGTLLGTLLRTKMYLERKKNTNPVMTQNVGGGTFQSENAQLRGSAVWQEIIAKKEVISFSTL